jgi:branched-chain amino acid transport system substrate-binding protein
MARAFADRFRALGGTLVATEYYRARDKDFGPHVRDIKGMIIGAEPDSTYFINAEGDTLNFDGVAAHVDCLFMPGTASQLKLLLAQVNYYNLQGEYLGTDGWGDEMIYKLDNSVTKRAVFPSPFLTVRSSEEYLEFATAFDSRYGKQPERLSRLGYDTMMLIAKAIKAGGHDRKSLIEQLAAIRDFEGAAGTYTFGNNHENIEMPLFRIINNRAVPYVDNGNTVTGVNSEQP